MIKCPNCNQENPNDSKFCSTCGKKLETFSTCPSCGGQVARGSAFCPQCGKKLNGDNNALVSDGVIAGDVSIDSSTKIDTSTNYNNSVVNIFNQSTENVKKCHACGKEIVKGSSEYHVCISCGKPFCSEHFDGSSMMCKPCLDAIESNLQNGEYGKANSNCRMAIVKGAKNPELYFYRAVCILGGKKAFVQQKSDIDDVVSLLKNAVALEPKAIYWYFLAYVKYDYFSRKFFAVTPDYKQCLAEAIKNGLTESDKRRLFSLLKVERPSCL